MLKTSCLKWNAKIKCQGRVRKNRNPGPHEVRAKLPPGSQAWHSCLEPEEGGRTGKLCPALGDPLGQPWNPSMHLTWKTVCVLSESVGTGNRFSTVKWKGQGDLGNPEYHVFPGACLTDGRSVDPSSSEPFWATRSASHWSRTGVRAPGTLSLADALRAWRPLDLVTQVSWEPVTRGPTLPNFFTGWTLESRAYLQACARMHADTDTHTHTPRLEPWILYLPFFTVKCLVKNRHFHLPPSPLLEIQPLLLTPGAPLWSPAAAWVIQWVGTRCGLWGPRPPSFLWLCSSLLLSRDLCSPDPAVNARCHSAHPPAPSPRDPRHLSCSPTSAPPSSPALGSLSLSHERCLPTLSARRCVPGGPC